MVFHMQSKLVSKRVHILLLQTVPHPSLPSPLHTLFSKGWEFSIRWFVWRELLKSLAPSRPLPYKAVKLEKKPFVIFYQITVKKGMQRHPIPLYIFLDFGNSKYQKPPRCQFSYTNHQNKYSPKIWLICDYYYVHKDNPNYWQV